MHSTPNSVDIPVVHYPTSVYPRDQGNLLCIVVSELSINMPVLSCLFHSSLKQTPDIRSSPYPPTRRDGSPLCPTAPGQPQARLTLPILYLNQGHLWSGGSR